MINSLYIHIPFCRKKCPYCDFYSVEYSQSIADVYIRTLEKQLDILDNVFLTIYIGGGTPSVLDSTLLKRLLDSLRKHTSYSKEFTFEMNPESLDQDKLKLLLESGVNRLSIGLQSLRNDKLNKLGRLHSLREGQESVILARKSGFKNISVDLIFGVSGETLSGWKKELKEVANLPVNHISAYALTYEKNTLLFEKLKAQIIQPLGDNVTSDMYKFTLDYLPKNSFNQYEVSNFSQSKYSCKHNLNYWDNGSYLGLGPSAVSYVDGKRKKNEVDIEKYIKKVGQGQDPVVFSEELTPLQRAQETAALKIRTNQGIDFTWFKETSGFEFLEIEGEQLKELKRKRLIRLKKELNNKRGRVFLTKKGFIFADTVSSSLL